MLKINVIECGSIDHGPAVYWTVCIDTKMHATYYSSTMRIGDEHNDPDHDGPPSFTTSPCDCKPIV